MRGATNKINRFVFLTIAIAALGGFVLGFDAGVIIDGKDQISGQFSLTHFQWSLLACMSILGSLLSVPFFGRFSDRWGPEKILMFAAQGFILGLLLCALAHSIAQLVIGRIIVGICIGIASFTCPLFIAEKSPPALRGGLVLLNGIAITGGQVLAFLLSYFIHDLSQSSWRIILWLEMIPAVSLLAGLLFMKINAKVKSKKSVFPALSFNDQFKTMFSKKMLSILIIGCGLGFLQQFSGINAILYYGPVVAQSVGFNTIKDALFATFCLGVINLCFTIVAAFLVDYCGRRLLLLCGTLLAGISMFCLGHVTGFWALILLCTYIIGYCLSLGSLFWVIVSEIFPQHIRGMAMGVVTSIQFMSSLMVSLSFLKLFDWLGQATTFKLFGSMSFVAFIFIYLFVPETKGVSLKLIESNLEQGKKLRDLGESLS